MMGELLKDKLALLISRAWCITCTTLYNWCCCKTFNQFRRVLDVLMKWDSPPVHKFKL
jgi:hypothetical protein